VNLAGVDVILNMREKMSKLQSEVEELFKYIREHISPDEESSRSLENALVRVPASKIVRSRVK
jgi:MerR family transcriptional regulator/heat shock protein HspR